MKLQLATLKQRLYNLLQQLAPSLLIGRFGNQLATSLWTTCNRLVVNKLLQVMRPHSDIGLLRQVVARCQQTCCNLRVCGCVAACMASIPPTSAASYRSSLLIVQRLIIAMHVYVKTGAQLTDDVGNSCNAVFTISLDICLTIPGRQTE